MVAQVYFLNFTLNLLPINVDYSHIYTLCIYFDTFWAQKDKDTAFKSLLYSTIYYLTMAVISRLTLLVQTIIAYF